MKGAIMKRSIALLTSVLLLASLVPTVSGVKQRSAPALKKPSKRPTKRTAKLKAKKAGLPEQPKCDYPASPDLVVEKFEYSGPSGKFKPSQRYGIGVVLKNIGQFESGVFIVKLQVRVQAPQSRIDRIVTIGSQKVKSIPPRKTGVSPGTKTVYFYYTTGNYVWAQYNFIATADATKHIKEWDELNNDKTSPDQVVDTLR
jgi:hypothetical protein